MRDFESAVRRNLGPLPLPPGRAEEIFRELAHQVEDAYREALARGVSASQAEGDAMAQLGNPEELRRCIISSERGKKVLWPHPWAVSRPACWLALAALGALCLVPAFRLSMLASTTAWSFRSPMPSPDVLKALAARGERDHDAKLMAFAALHLANDDEFTASQYAEKAIAIDPSLTWIGARFISRFRYPNDPRVDRDAWARRVIAWDPDNAAPKLVANESLFRTAIPDGVLGPAYDPQIAHLAETTPWGQQMRAAFDAPRYDTYNRRRFDLDREVLSNLGGQRWETMVWGSAQLGPFFTDSIQIQRYAALITGSLGPQAERAGHDADAAQLYWTVARFGERMQEDSSWGWQRETAFGVQSSAYAALADLARRKGNLEQASAFDLVRQRVDKARTDSRAERDYLFRSRWESARRTAGLASLAASLAALFALASGLWILLAGFRGADRAMSGWTGALALGSSYAPGLLLASSCVACSTLWPFLRSPADFPSQESMFLEMAPFWFSFWGAGWSPLGIEWRFYFQQLFWPGTWSLAVLILGLAALHLLARQRATRTPQSE